MFTGNDTKIIMNQGKYKFKKSLNEKIVNIFLAWNVFLMLIPMGLSLMSICYSFVSTHLNHTYLFPESDYSPIVAMLQAYGSFYLLDNSFIPLDLVVLVDTAKIAYAIVMEWDANMYGSTVKNMSLHEDLA